MSAPPTPTRRLYPRCYRGEAWANRRVLVAAGQLPTAEFRAAEHPDFGSVGTALVPVRNAERTWPAWARGPARPVL
ncbi:MAG: hypothetical protein M3Q10_13285, partial [Chloroflexota bacterium]|nr:hypothetical protein [Chloroflexota bacterium]